MPEAPFAEGPRSAPARKIRPAGWLVLLLLVGGAGWFAWTQFGDSIRALIDRPAAPARPASPGTTTTLAPDAGMLPRDLFPSAAASLPVVRGATGRLALPPLVALEAPAQGVIPADSELAAIRAVLGGQADVAVASVASLAAVPEALAAGVRAAWLVGESPRDAALFPACDGASLSAASLGAVRGSIGHFHLLGALAGLELPTISLFDGDADLAAAIAAGRVTAGATRLGAPDAAEARPPCRALPSGSLSLVVIRQVGQALSAAELASIVALSRLPAPSPEEVAAFFDPARTAPGGFFELYASAADVWARTGLIAAPARAASAVDRTFLEGGAGAFAPIRGRRAPASSARDLGYPSWVDR